MTDRNSHIEEIDSYLQEAFKLYLRDRAKSLENAEKAFKLLENVSYPKGTGDYYLITGKLKRDSGNIEEAKSNLNKALKIYGLRKDNEGVSEVLFNISIMEIMSGLNEQALETMKQSLQIRQQLNDVKGICFCVINMAFIYLRLGDPATGLSNLLEMIDKYAIKDDPFLKYRTYMSMSDMYFAMKLYDDSLHYLQECTKINAPEIFDYHRSELKIKMANIFLKKEQYEKALELYHQVLDYDTSAYKGSEGNIYNNIGLAYYAIKNYDEASKYFSLAAPIFTKLGDDYSLTNIISNFGQIYYYTEKIDEAIESFNKSLELADKISSKWQLGDINKWLYKCYLEKNEPVKALKYLEKHTEIENNRHTEETKMLSDNLHKLYEVKIKAREAELLKDKNEKLNSALSKVEAQNKRLEELNTEINELLRIVAHDIKNPSNNIVGLARTILDEGKEVNLDELNDSLENIINCSTQIDNIIYNILKSSSLESGKLRPVLNEVNISQLIKDIIHFNKNTADRKSLKIVFEGKDDVNFITDKTFLQQIIDNLLSNAMKFSNANTKIVIKLDRSGSSLQISVKDEGPGIKKEEIDRLFHKFTRLSARPTRGESSTGLGLSIVKKLTDILNGEVWCESEPGKGAEFIIRFNEN